MSIYVIAFIIPMVPWVFAWIVFRVTGGFGSHPSRGGGVAYFAFSFAADTRSCTCALIDEETEVCNRLL